MDAERYSCCVLRTCLSFHSAGSAHYPVPRGPGPPVETLRDQSRVESVGRVWRTQPPRASCEQVLYGPQDAEAQGLMFLPTSIIQTNYLALTLQVLGLPLWLSW